MKKLFLIIFNFYVLFSLNAQTINTRDVVKKIIEPRNIYLNGGARASVGGKSRTTIQVALPPNTVSWYYSFSTSPGESGMKNLNLFGQLYALSIDPTGFTSNIISGIQVPDGSASIDAYLFDQKNSDLFIQKVDNDGGSFSYYREGMVTNTKQAAIKINNANQGTFYIGLKNPSGFVGVNITIEVVAIVREIEKQSAEQIEAITLGNMGWKAFERNDYDTCLKLSEQALVLDNSLAYVHFNIALCYLINGQDIDAVSKYSKAIALAKKTSIPKRTFEGAINDLRFYMNQFPSKDQATDILNILLDEIKNY